MKVLVTGAAGFIGFHLCIRLIDDGFTVVGIDNLNNYYDRKLKYKRLKILRGKKSFYFIKGDLNGKKVKNFLKKNIERFEFIYHFAGQAGVRYSLENPYTYINNNILVFLKILEIFKKSKKIRCLFYASSSSVYGDEAKMISNKKNLKPKSVYAISKLTMENLASFYSELYKKKIIGLRFFSVYGPFGRPDMFYFKFLLYFFKKKKIKVFNNGLNYRSYTYIDDLINNICILKNNLHKIKKNNDIFNIGNPDTFSTNKVISVLENLTRKKIKKTFTKKNLIESLKTKANLKKEKKFNFSFKTNIKQGLTFFYSWFMKNYSI